MSTVPAKVLVVEDEWITAQDLQQTLSHLGYDVPGMAGSGEEALAQAEQLRPDLVLMDIRLKGAMDGIEAARELRRRSGVPVVFLTAHSDEATLARAKEVEPHGFLVKPFSEAELRSTVEIALHKSRAEQMVQASERRFRALTEHSTDLVSLLDAAGTVRYESDSVERVLGYNKEERVGQSAFDLIHPEDVPEVLAAFQRVIAEPGQAHRVELRARHKEGFWRWLEAIGANHLNDPAVEGIVVTSRDVTERKEAEEALRRREAQLAEAQRLAGVGSWEWDIPENRVTWSDNLYRIYGLRPGESPATFQAYLQRVHSDDRQNTQVTIEQAIRSQEGCEFEERIIRPDGSVRVLQSWGEVIVDASGQPVRMIGTCQDITERKRMEDALRAAKKAAEAANRAKSEMLSRTSHELRTPLNAILGFAQVLEMDVKDEQDRESVEQILRAGRHLLNLIDEVLDIACAESDPMALPSEPVHVGELIEETLSLLHPLASQSRVELSRSPLDRCRARVLADQQRLTQVLLNLIENGIKHNREGGRVEVSCEEVSGEHLRIQVCDSGPGIPPEKLSRLFSPFDRLDTEKSGIGAVEGTGLGLAVAKAFIEAMSGKIGVESTPGQGSTFWIELPYVPDPLENTSEEGFGAILSGSAPVAPVVLYVDDESANLRLIERLFHRSRPDIELITATKGGEGLNLARERQPDLILLDLNLPDMSGEEVLLALRQEERTEAIPVVMLSGDVSPAQVERMRNHGAMDYITKPFQVPHFLEIIGGFIGAGK